MTEMNAELFKLIKTYKGIANIPDDVLIENGYIRHKKMVKVDGQPSRETIVVVSMDTLSDKQIAKAYKDLGLALICKEDSETGTKSSEELSIDSLIENAQERVKAGFKGAISLYLSLEQKKALVDGVYDWVSTVYSTVEEKSDRIISPKYGKAKQDGKNKLSLTPELVPQIQFVEKGNQYFQRNPTNVRYGGIVIDYALKVFLDGYTPDEDRKFGVCFREGERKYLQEKSERKKGRMAQRALEELGSETI